MLTLAGIDYPLSMVGRESGPSDGHALRYGKRGATGVVRLANIAAPVLLAQGGEDRVVPAGTRAASGVTRLRAGAPEGPASEAFNRLLQATTRRAPG